MHRVLRPICVLVAMVLWAAPVRADEIDDMRDRALALSKEGQWEEARLELERALARRDDPVTAYFLAVAEMATGRSAAALVRFRRFLAGPASPAIERYGPAARDAVAELEGQVGRVTITTDPAVADISVMLDGKEVAAGVEHVVEPGVHVVVVRAAGYAHARRELTLGPGGVEAARFALEALPSPEGDTAAEASPPIAAAVLLGSGALVFGAGLWIGLAGVREADEAPSAEGPEADSARDKALAGDIVAGVGIATAAVGLVLLIVHYATHSEHGDTERGALDAALREGLTLRF
jgi:hypothetical protein